MMRGADYIRRPSAAVVHNCFAQCANRHVDICAGLAVCTMNNEASLNPYATPRAVVADPGASEVEIVRKEHITHEASVKSAGLLFIGTLVNGYILWLVLSRKGRMVLFRGICIHH
jgi:hypothetical protein